MIGDSEGGKLLAGHLTVIGLAQKRHNHALLSMEQHVSFLNRLGELY